MTAIKYINELREIKKQYEYDPIVQLTCYRGGDIINIYESRLSSFLTTRKIPTKFFEEISSKFERIEILDMTKSLLENITNSALECKPDMKKIKDWFNQHTNQTPNEITEPTKAIPLSDIDKSTIKLGG